MRARNTTSTGRRACFTLLELLIVIGIILIILGFTVPSFRRMASGNAVNASARMITGQLRLARAAAITEQRYIALIMPGENFNEPCASGSGKHDNEEDDYHFRSFRVGVVRPKSGTVNQFELVEWYPGTTWTFLPVGAVIASVRGKCIEERSTANDDYELYYGKTGGKDDPTKLLVNENWAKNSNGIGLTDNISQNNTSEEYAPYVIDYDNTKNLATVDLWSNTNGSSTACARCVVFNPKGRCCTANSNGGTEPQKQYITIVEGNVDVDSNNKFTLTEPNVHNMRIIKISQMTGRSSYVAIGEE